MCITNPDKRWQSHVTECSQARSSRYVSGFYLKVLVLKINNSLQKSLTFFWKFIWELVVLSRKDGTFCYHTSAANKHKNIWDDGWNTVWIVLEHCFQQCACCYYFQRMVIAIYHKWKAGDVPLFKTYIHLLMEQSFLCFKWLCHEAGQSRQRREWNLFNTWVLLWPKLHFFRFF